MAKRHTPTKPELDQHPNGLRLVRYPFKTPRGSTVTRNYKLGFMSEEKAKALFVTFMEQWQKMNGDGPAGVVAALDRKREHKTGLPAVIKEKPKKGDVFKTSEAKREKARSYYYAAKEKRANGNGNGGGTAKASKAGSPDISQMRDMVGVMVASLSAVSTSLKMLQDQLNKMQH